MNERKSVLDRYSRQTNYRNLREAGQEALLRSRVVVVGMGALGCVSANELVRAGIGYVRIIDDDCVEIANLHRQILFTEEHAKRQALKAEAAAEALRAANSEIEIESITERLTPENAERLLGGIDLVIDATDNIETRYLINEYCVENAIPWIYGGAVEAEGMTAVFLPGGPCMSCMLGTSQPGGGSQPRKASQVGVLNMLTAIVSSLQIMEAVKILTGAPTVQRDMLFFDIWENDLESIPIEKDPDCPICGKKEYRFLNRT